MQSSFAALLMSSVTPLSAYVPESKAPSARVVAPKQLRNTARANKAAHDQAVVRYRAVMSTEWCGTRLIESRLGMGRSCCIANLKKWEGLGLVESRIIGPASDWNRRKGYEWRFK